jgi:HemY protein
MMRGETVRPPSGQASGMIDTTAIALEERDEHGVPRMRE